MRDYVIPPPRPLYLRLADRLAEATLLASIAALAALALGVQLGG